MRLYDYAASGNCYKVRLLLSLLGREYERVPVDIFAGDTLTDAFAALNPVRETPVLELDSGAVVAQSSAILWYLAEGTPFLPSGRLERALVLQWLAFEQERVMGGIGGPRFRRLTGRPAIEGRLEIGAQALELLGEHLAEPGWLVGESPTIADIAVFGYAHVAHEAGLEPGERVLVWFDRVRALPGFVADLEPYGANARPGAGRSIYG
jgi:glutathione S-transferase